MYVRVLTAISALALRFVGAVFARDEAIPLPPAIDPRRRLRVGAAPG
jgi:hypothetical protein